MLVMKYTLSEFYFIIHLYHTSISFKYIYIFVFFYSLATLYILMTS